MTYDKKLDKVLWEKSERVGNDALILQVYQYNEGKKKLQITRKAVEEDKFTKLGRISAEEFDAIFPLLKEARDNMN